MWSSICCEPSHYEMLKHWIMYKWTHCSVSAYIYLIKSQLLEFDNHTKSYCSSGFPLIDHAALMQIHWYLIDNAGQQYFNTADNSITNCVKGELVKRFSCVYFVCENEFLLPAVSLNEVKPSGRRAQSQPLPGHGETRALRETQTEGY